MKFIKDNWCWMAVSLVLIFVMVTYPGGWGCATQEEPADTITPAVNPLTADLKEANEIIDQLVGFNNFLIRDLEECQDERAIEAD